MTNKWPDEIPSELLTLADVPDESADWSAIGRFALTLPPSENNPYNVDEEDWGRLTNASSLVDMRSRLYLEQRRWNHYGRRPSADIVRQAQRVIALIRARLSERTNRSI
jgi:hypothetical protein